jgi:cytosine/adenosine deaminase-related metal-dependent hydrolase
VEAIGFDEARAEKSFSAACDVLEQFVATPSTSEKSARQSIVPHAPYSVSEKLFRLINGHDAQAAISVHNQESDAERTWYTTGTGPVRDLLTNLGLDLSQFSPSGKSSLLTYSDWIDATHPLLLVHNTDTTAEEVSITEARFPSLAWCLCPGANLYIEGRLPDVRMLIEHAKTICLGTDSLASNNQLSILAEMRILRENFPEVSDEVLLRWATLNGAVALGMDDHIGSFERGKTPGVLLLTEDFASVQRLV